MDDERDPARVLAALGLTPDATNTEILSAARRLDPDAPENAVEAIRVVIEAVRAVGYPQDGLVILSDLRILPAEAGL